MPPTTPSVINPARTLQWKHKDVEWTITVFKQVDGRFVANTRHKTPTGSNGFNCEDISEAGAIKRAKRAVKALG